MALVSQTPVGNGSVQGGYRFQHDAVVAEEAIDKQLRCYILAEEVVVAAPSKADGVAGMAEIGIVGIFYGSTGVRG